MTRFYQCELSQGTARTKAFIEARGASVGKLVEIKEPGFDGLWHVDTVAEKGIDETVLRAQQRKSRNAFGSILPKE